jgi:hypothetical protein
MKKKQLCACTKRSDIHYTGGLQVRVRKPVHAVRGERFATPVLLQMGKNKSVLV